jgi:hypothetical protein
MDKKKQVRVIYLRERVEKLEVLLLLLRRRRERVGLQEEEEEDDDGM